MSDSTNTDFESDGDAERALRDGLKASALSAAAMQRIRQATEQEWRTAVRAPATRRPHAFSIAASAAGILAVSLWAFFALQTGPAAGEVFGRVVAVEHPGLVEPKRFGRDVQLAAGTSLRVGQKLEARGDTVVNLEAGGNLRIARTSAIEVHAPDVIALTQGELYVDIPPGAHSASAFRVQTSAGEFRHVGTQFALMISEGQTRLRVREGQVVWRAASGDSTVAAGTEVTIGPDGKATRRPVSTAGRDWTWTEAMAPDVVIENRPLIEFLQWFARETGRTLDIDERSREQAATILMHGSVKGLTVPEALSAVMSTTSSLRYELPEGVIRVSSAGDPKLPRP